VLTLDLLEHLEDSEYDIIYIAESASLASFGMMQTSGPVDRDVGRARAELSRSCERGARIHLAEIEHVREDGTVVGAVKCVDEMHVVGLI
jgi:hypothetical protein